MTTDHGPRLFVGSGTSTFVVVFLNRHPGDQQASLANPHHRRQPERDVLVSRHAYC